MSTAPDNRLERDDEQEGQDGQVSEVSSLRADTEQDGIEAPGQPITPGDSVAGQPDGESGRTDEGPTGPDAPTFAGEQDRYPDKDDVETTG